MRRISRTSRKPSVVMRPVAAPVRVMMALVATVAPWVKDRTADAATPFSASASATPCRMAALKCGGEERTFFGTARPPGDIRTMSVKVPPTSTPSRYRSSELNEFCLFFIRIHVSLANLHSPWPATLAQGFRSPELVSMARRTCEAVSVAMSARCRTTPSTNPTLQGTVGPMAGRIGACSAHLAVHKAPGGRPATRPWKAAGGGVRMVRNQATFCLFRQIGSCAATDSRIQLR